MAEILCSTGALIGRPNNRNHKLLKELTPQIDCDGFEFMMYDSWYEKVDEIVTDLQNMKLHISVMHCEKHIGEAISRSEAGDMEEALRRFVINCGIAQRVGARKMVVHLWDGLTSDQHFENNLAAYPELAEIARDYELELLVENVVCNKENPMKHWRELAEHYPEIGFIFDTKMAAFHGQLDMLYQEEYSWLWKNGHLRHFHVNDYAGGYMDWSRLRTLPIGEGHIDFERFFKFVREIGYDDTFTVEATAFNAEGIVDTDMLNRCVGYIRKRV